MSRKAVVSKREIEADPIYGSKLVAKLINRAMLSGKRMSVAKQVYEAFVLIQEKTNKDPMEIFNQALENIRPLMEVRPRRIGGAAYQVPMSVRGSRRDSLAIRWLVQSSRARANKEYHRFSEKLAAEVIDALHNQGGAVKKRENIHRMAEANKAFAHFRW